MRERLGPGGRYPRSGHVPAVQSRGPDLSPAAGDCTSWVHARPQTDRAPEAGPHIGRAVIGARGYPILTAAGPRRPACRAPRTRRGCRPSTRGRAVLVLLAVALGLAVALVIALAVGLAAALLVLHVLRLDLQLRRLLRARVEARAHLVALLELIQASLGTVARDRRARGDLQLLLAAGRGRDLHRLLVLVDLLHLAGELVAGARGRRRPCLARRARGRRRLARRARGRRRLARRARGRGRLARRALRRRRRHAHQPCRRYSDKKRLHHRFYLLWTGKLKERRPRREVRAGPQQQAARPGRCKHVDRPSVPLLRRRAPRCDPRGPGRTRDIP